MLAEWLGQGPLAVKVQGIRSRLKVTYNTTATNQLHAGSGLDWFWFTNPKDQVNNKAGDPIN